MYCVLCIAYCVLWGRYGPQSIQNDTFIEFDALRGHAVRLRVFLPQLTIRNMRVRWHEPNMTCHSHLELMAMNAVWAVQPAVGARARCM